MQLMLQYIVGTTTIAIETAEEVPETTGLYCNELFFSRQKSHF